MKESNCRNRKMNGVCNYHQGKAEEEEEEAELKKRNLPTLSPGILYSLSSHLSNQRDPLLADGSNFFGKCGVSNSLFGTNPVILLGGFKEVELNLEQPPTICHISAYFCIFLNIFAYHGILRSMTYCA